MATAILVDTAFFLKRFRHVYPDLNSRDPEQVGRTLYTMCMTHVSGHGAVPDPRLRLPPAR